MNKIEIIFCCFQMHTQKLTWAFVWNGEVEGATAIKWLTVAVRFSKFNLHFPYCMFDISFWVKTTCCVGKWWQTNSVCISNFNMMLKLLSLKFNYCFLALKMMNLFRW